MRHASFDRLQVAPQRIARAAQPFGQAFDLGGAVAQTGGVFGLHCPREARQHDGAIGSGRATTKEGR